MAVRQEFPQGLSLNLASALSAVAVVLTPPSYASWPATGRFLLKCESEIFEVTNAATHPWPIARGQQGTTAAAHVLGALVTSPLTAGALDRLVGLSAGGTLVLAARDLNFVGPFVAITNVAGVATLTGVVMQPLVDQTVPELVFANLDVIMVPS